MGGLICRVLNLLLLLTLAAAKTDLEPWCIYTNGTQSCTVSNIVQFSNFTASASALTVTGITPNATVLLATSGTPSMLA
jgi:hypothetical protein